MILNELFDSAVPFQLTTDGTGYFRIDGRTYEVSFDPLINERGAVEVSFSMRQGVTASGMPGYVHSATGTGDELQVFSTVINVIREYMRRSPTRKIVFAAKTSEPSRVRLYDRMARTLSPGWHVSTSMLGKEKMYTLTDPNEHARSPSPSDESASEDVPF